MRAPPRPVDGGCIFCAPPAASLFAQNALAYALRDIAPATPLHTLVLPRRHVASWFALRAPERRAIEALLLRAARQIQGLDPEVAGFNIAINIGEAAGQTVPHCHIHLVPRRAGDGEAVVLSGRHKRLLGLPTGQG